MGVQTRELPIETSVPSLLLFFNMTSTLDHLLDGLRRASRILLPQSAVTEKLVMTSVGCVGVRGRVRKWNHLNLTVEE